MTTPTERTRAVIELGLAVRAMAPYMHGSSETVRVPRELIRQLHAWLRHYPMPSELWMTAEVAPHLWSGHRKHSMTASLTDAEIAELRGQAVVLRRLLADALAVLCTIEPDDADEAERLESLCAAVALTVQPKREGTLL